MSNYSRLITDNLAFIEKQCRRAVSRCFTPGGAVPDDGVAVDNESDELLNEVLDRLKSDDFKALREFKGSARITTYITTIISNLVVDLVRQKKGRSRAWERAREMGKVAEELYDLVFSRGWSLHEAHGHLEETLGGESLQDLQLMLQRMRGRERSQLPAPPDGEAAWLVPGREIEVDGAVELVVADPRKNAEAALISDQKRRRAREAVAGLIDELSGEERLMIRMRFTAEDEEPKSVREIAQMLGLSEKSVDARIRRILTRFREILLRQGVALKDLIDA